MSSQLIPTRLTHTSCAHICALAHAGNGLPDFLPEFSERITADVAQCAMLHRVTHTLQRIEFRRLAREREHRDAAGRANVDLLQLFHAMETGGYAHGCSKISI